MADWPWMRGRGNSDPNLPPQPDVSLSGERILDDETRQRDIGNVRRALDTVPDFAETALALWVQTVEGKNPDITEAELELERTMGNLMLEAISGGDAEVIATIDDMQLVSFSGSAFGALQLS